MSWICMRCKQDVPHPLDRIEKRLDYRKGGKSDRLWNKTVMNLCRDCAKLDMQEELERHKDFIVLLPGRRERIELEGQTSWV